MNVRQAAIEGGRAALAAFGLPSQPSLNSLGGIKMPDMTGLPKAGKPASRMATPDASVPSPSPGLGTAAAKIAFNVGVGASNSPLGGAGSVQGEPADEGRRQRSVIDRTLQQNDDFFASSSAPAPGGQVAP